MLCSTVIMPQTSEKKKKLKWERKGICCGQLMKLRFCLTQSGILKKKSTKLSIESPLKTSMSALTVH